MSEANHPQNQNSPKFTESTGASADSLAFPPKPSDDDWETVDFPHAISIDSLFKKEVPGNDSLSDSRDITNQAEINPLETSGNQATATDPTTSIFQTTDLPFPESHHSETAQFNTQDWIQGPSFVIHRHLMSTDSTNSNNSEPLTPHSENTQQDLNNRVIELEAALSQCKKTLQEQETLIHQQTQDLRTAQKQVTRLFSKLELAHQILQQQEVMAESLKAQWHQSQLRLAEMERECALTQQRYNESTHQLMLSETLCRELRSRLHRQQRHTLQFKTALERCLEMTLRKDIGDAQNSFANSAHQNFNSELWNSSLHTSPVQPWSAPPEASEEHSHSLSATSAEEEWAKELIQKLAEFGNSTPAPTNSPDFPPAPPTVPETSPPVFPHLQTYWHITSEQPPAAPESVASESSVTEKSHPSETNTLPPDFSTLDQTEVIPDNPFSAEDFTESVAEVPESELEEQWQQAQQWQAKIQPPAPKTASNWPAPLVYPQRPLKKPASLAAIQLPSF